MPLSISGLAWHLVSFYLWVPKRWETRLACIQVPLHISKANLWMPMWLSVLKRKDVRSYNVQVGVKLWESPCGQQRNGDLDSCGQEKLQTELFWGRYIYMYIGMGLKFCAHFWPHDQKKQKSFSNQYVIGFNNTCRCCCVCHCSWDKSQDDHHGCCNDDSVFTFCCYLWGWCRKQLIIEVQEPLKLQVPRALKEHLVEQLRTFFLPKDN